jgi:predicted DNA-binding ribbon-helix-helix protein
MEYIELIKQIANAPAGPEYTYRRLPIDGRREFIKLEPIAWQILYRMAGADGIAVQDLIATCRQEFDARISRVARGFAIVEANSFSAFLRSVCFAFVLQTSGRFDLVNLIARAGFGDNPPVSPKHIKLNKVTTAEGVDFVPVSAYERLATVGGLEYRVIADQRSTENIWTLNGRRFKTLAQVAKWIKAPTPKDTLPPPDLAGKHINVIDGIEFFFINPRRRCAVLNNRRFDILQIGSGLASWKIDEKAFANVDDVAAWIKATTSADHKQVPRRPLDQEGRTGCPDTIGLENFRSGGRRGNGIR